MKTLWLLSLWPSLIAAFQLPARCCRRIQSQSQRFESLSPLDQAESDDEWHPHDPANTVPQLLSSLWSQIAQAGNMVKGVREK